MKPLIPQQKLWVEADGQLVMSDYRLRLLTLVSETGSLAQAAQRLNLSYRRAWGKVKELEQNIGASLVASEVGGAGGGQTTLTPYGEALVKAYATFQSRMGEELQRVFEEEVLAALPPGDS